VERRQQIVIIGGGFSGAAVAIHLLRAHQPAVAVTVIEPDERLGPGLAFGACDPMHLLNVPAGRMSALPDEPDHFLRWLETARATPRHSELVPADLNSRSFVSRRLFGDCIAELLATTAATSSGSLRHLRGAALGIDRTTRGLAIAVSSGEPIAADRVVLALGNFAPTTPHPACTAIADHPGYVHDIWNRKPWLDGTHDDDILFIGTGLTMVDAVLAFARSGHRGTLIGLSRRGLLPSIHLLGGNHPSFVAPATEHLDIRTVVRRIRAEVRRGQAAGTPWQAVIDSLRAATPTLWNDFSPADKRRFLRHLKSYWETNRHRLAPQLAVELENLREVGRFELAAGALVGATPRGSRFEVRIRPRRSTAIVERTVGRIINCTGPEARLDRHTSPLFGALFDGGLVSSDPLGVGLAADPAGFVRDAQGEVVRDIATLGGLLKGLYWETTAVPEIRVQAAGLARALCSDLNRSR
jgi:uncharacterized NAD(P)/FAD-binding protein YdhS